MMVFGPSKSYFGSSSAKLIKPNWAIWAWSGRIYVFCSNNYPRNWDMALMSSTSVTVTAILLPLNKVVLHFLWLCAVLRLAIPSDPVVLLTHRGDVVLGFGVPPQYLRLTVFNTLTWRRHVQKGNPLSCKWHFFQSPLCP
jgi:hypothetical protein